MLSPVPFEDISAENLKVKYLERARMDHLSWTIQKIVRIVCSLCTCARSA
jgi:hypothetical protein